MATLNLTKVPIQDLATGRAPYPKGWHYKSSPPRICANGKEWRLVAIPRYLGGKMILVVGSDGKRYRDLLFCPETQMIGTRGEIMAELDIRSFYPSQHTTTKKRRIQARQQIFRRLNLYVDPTRDNEFNPPHKGHRKGWRTYWQRRMLAGAEDIVVVQPKGMRSVTWKKLLNRLRKWSGQKPIKYLPGRRRTRRSIQA
jgi:hypothetical protein